MLTVSHFHSEANNPHTIDHLRVALPDNPALEIDLASLDRPADNGCTRPSIVKQIRCRCGPIA